MPESEKDYLRRRVNEVFADSLSRDEWLAMGSHRGWTIELDKIRALHKPIECQQCAVSSETMCGSVYCYICMDDYPCDAMQALEEGEASHISDTNLVNDQYVQLRRDLRGMLADFSRQQPAWGDAALESLWAERIIAYVKEALDGEK